jgi:hypothetical protein
VNCPRSFAVLHASRTKYALDLSILILSTPALNAWALLVFLVEKGVALEQNKNLDGLTHVLMHGV